MEGVGEGRGGKEEEGEEVDYRSDRYERSIANRDESGILMDLVRQLSDSRYDWQMMQARNTRVLSHSTFGPYRLRLGFQDKGRPALAARTVLRWER